MQQSRSNAQAKHWCFTINDSLQRFSYENVVEFLHPHADYLVFQKELGAEGTHHYQGYVEFTKALRLTQIQKLSNVIKPHWEKRRGTRQQARDYAMKDDTRVDGPWESGQKPWSEKQGNSGARTDLANIADLVKSGKTDNEIFEENPGATLVHLKHIQHLRMVFKPERTTELEVCIAYGEPGSGKTRSFWALYPNGWSVPVSRQTGWFSNYQQQREVLIDDYAGGIPLTNLLQILDRYPILLESKGSHVWWCPDTIIITCNVHPWGWYDYSQRQSSYAALKRRVSMVKHYVDYPSQSASNVDVEEFFELMKPTTTRFSVTTVTGQ